MSVAEEKKSRRLYMGADGNALVSLIILIMIAFVLLKFIYVIYLLSELNVAAYQKNVFNWFVLSADPGRLATRPWTIITYMFVHDNVFHMIGNLLWIWAFGYILQDIAGNGKLIPIFFYGGLIGAVFYIVAYSIIPKLQPGLAEATLIGSNSAVMALAIATTTVSPDYRLFPMINGGIPLWILTVLFVIINFAGVPANDPAVYIALVASAAIGFIFVYFLRRGKDWSEPVNAFFDWISNLFNPNKNIKKREQVKKKEDVFYNTPSKTPYKKKSHPSQSKIDSILDKINQKGYNFLTDEEKDILKRAAEDDS